MNGAIGKAPGFYASPPDTSQAQVSETGGASLGVGVGEAPKGLPFTLLSIMETDHVERHLGKPWHPSVGPKHEHLRQLTDAVGGAPVKFVRVVASDALFPVIRLKPNATPDAWEVVNDTSSFGVDIVVGAPEVMAIYPYDGDPSTKRRVSISLNANTERFTLLFEEQNSLGDWLEIEGERHEGLSVDVDATSDLGVPAYVSAVLDAKQSRFRVEITPGTTFSDLYDLPATVFTGGANGGTPTSDDYDRAINILKKADVFATDVIALGHYDPVLLSKLSEVASSKDGGFWGDAPPSMNNSQAIAFMGTLGITYRYAVFTHFPYSATDRVYGGKAVWGTSGAAFAMKARGNSQYKGTVPSVHLSPAGINRGVLNRQSVAALFPEDVVDGDAMVEARLNGFAFDEGRAYLNDALTLHPKSDYMRYEWVNAIHSEILRRIKTLAKQFQHEPDVAMARFEKRVINELKNFVTSGALVKGEGDPGFFVSLRKSTSDPDLWEITWSFRPTGSARRIIGLPVIMS